MIDDPKKELQDLDAQLQALNTRDDEFEDFYADILAEFGEKPSSEEDYLKGLLKEEPKHSRPVNNTTTYADKQKKAAPVKKDHSIRNLVILIIIELLGIGGVAAWWILRLL